jgi:hypothetical protein
MWSVFSEKSKDNNWRPAEVNASDILFVYVGVYVGVYVCTRNKLFVRRVGIQKSSSFKKKKQVFEFPWLKFTAKRYTRHYFGPIIPSSFRASGSERWFQKKRKKGR